MFTNIIFILIAILIIILCFYRLFFNGKKSKIIKRCSLEKILLQQEFGIIKSQEILYELNKSIKDPDKVDINILSDQLNQVLFSKLQYIFNKKLIEKVNNSEKPYTILIIGANGVGKTTTIAKLGYLFKNLGKKVKFVACDTFRTGAIEQINYWGNKLGIEVFSNKSTKQPSTVVYDALSPNNSKNFDVIIVDSAGRLCQENLTDELKKLSDTMTKINSNSPNEKLMLIDSQSGQNILKIAEWFIEKIGITGFIITKLDGTAHGGIIFTLVNKFKLPIYFLTYGENEENIEIFDPKKFCKHFTDKIIKNIDR